MQDKRERDPQEARYLRRQYDREGYDQQQQQQEQQFKHNLERAIVNNSLKVTQKNLQDQINYFGNAIQPFHMRNQEQIGDIDEDGFFIFKRKAKHRDAWLESIEEADQHQLAEKIRKQIKTNNGRYKSVNEAESKLNQKYVENEVSDEQKDENKLDIQQKESEQSQKFKPKEIIEYLVSILPPNKNANTFLKTLKKQKRDQQYDKIILLCNQYIEQTEDHQILTKKKQTLQEELYGQEQQSQQLNWDDEPNQDDKDELNIKKKESQ